MKRVNYWVLLASIVVIVGFFLPWIKTAEGDSISGIGLVRLDQSGYYFAFALPVTAFVCAALAIKLRKTSAIFAVLTGAVAVGWGLFEAFRFLHEYTFPGLWLSVFGCLLLFAAGLVSFARSSRNEEDTKKALDENKAEVAPTEVPSTEVEEVEDPLKKAP